MDDGRRGHALSHRTGLKQFVLLLALASLGCDRERSYPTAHNVGQARLRGTVIRIADGDSITLLDANHVEQRIRLSGIDAPERGQPFGRDAKQSLSSIAFGKVAEVEWETRDRYGRIVGKVMLPDPACKTRECPNNVDAGLIQLHRGMAWWYRSYADQQSRTDRRAYDDAERDARRRHAGVWSDPDSIPPWEWRRETAER